MKHLLPHLLLVLAGALISPHQRISTARNRCGRLLPPPHRPAVSILGVVATKELIDEKPIVIEELKGSRKCDSIWFKSASMGLTYGLADIAAQVFTRVIEGETVPILSSLRRTVSLTAVGFLVVGPLLTLWFEFIDRLLPGKSKRAILG